MALEIEKLKMPNVVVEKSSLKKLLDARYSESSRLLLITDYMNKRHAKYLIDLRGYCVPKDKIRYEIWDPHISKVYCHYRRLDQISEYFKNNEKIKFESEFPYHPNYFRLLFLPYRTRSESLVFLKDFVSFFQSRL